MKQSTTSRKRRMAGFLAGSALLASGCTTHLVSTGDAGTSGPGDAFTEGAVYRLPIRTFKVTVTWQLANCEITAPPTRDAVVEFTQIAEITPEIAEGESLVIDYRRMTGPFKTGKLDIKYRTIGEGKDARATMLIQSFNSEIDGQEAEAIKAGVGAIGSLAKIALTASGVPLPGGGVLSVKPDFIRCNDHVVSGIAKLDGHEKNLKRIASELAKRTLRITLLSGRVVGGKLTPADEAELATINAEVDSLDKEKDRETKLAEKLKELLSYKQTYSISELNWPDEWQKTPKPVAMLTKELKPDAAKIGALANKALEIDDAWCTLNEAQTKECLRIRKALSDTASSSTVNMEMTATGPGVTSFTPAFSVLPSSLLEKMSFNGLVYREPVPATVRVTGRDSETIAELVTSIPQYGRVRVLPLRSRFGERNGLAAEFAADGLPTSVKYEAYRAGGVAALQSAQLVFDEAGKVVGAIAADREAKRKEEDGAALQAIKDRITLLTEQQKLSALERIPDPDIAAREAELQSLRFEVERQELLAKLGRSTT